MTEKKRKRQPVLGDHKRQGKKFVPPFIAQLGRLNEVRWVNDLLPEMLWLGMLNEQFGLHRGAELALQLAKAADEALHKKHDRWLHMTSQYLGIPEAVWPSVLAGVSPKDLEQIKAAVRPLVALYPQCALRNLWSEAPQVLTGDVVEMGDAVGKLLDRTSQSATYAQANAIYLMFVTEKLSVHKGSMLTEIESVVEYPTSEKSRMVASAIRASITGFGSRDDESSRNWSTYFWRRGLELSPCQLQDPEMP
jgi:hypothetical protein